MDDGKLKITRAQLENPCKDCGVPEGRPALCCQEFVVETPRDSTDWLQVDLDVLHWYLVRGHRMGWRIEARFPGRPSLNADYWEVLVPVPCPMLDGNRCTIYETRPSICREYPPFPSVRADNPNIAVTGCDRYDPRPPLSASFSDPQELAEHLEQWFGYRLEEHIHFIPDKQRVEIIDE